MTLFLFKPHVVGSTDQITTPDVIVDHVVLNGTVVPVHRLTHDAWLQGAETEMTCAAYAVMALGGGPLVLPVVALSSGPIVVARKAWRLAHIEAHAGEVTLNGVPLLEIGLPSAVTEDLTGSCKSVPRGHLMIRTVPGQSVSSNLHDPKLGRSLRHAVVFEPLAAKRWLDGSPLPRYSVGPTKKDVPHFI